MTLEDPRTTVANQSSDPLWSKEKQIQLSQPTSGLSDGVRDVWDTRKRQQGGGCGWWLTPGPGGWHPDHPPSGSGSLSADEGLRPLITTGPPAGLGPRALCSGWTEGILTGPLSTPILLWAKQRSLALEAQFTASETTAASDSLCQ